MEVEARDSSYLLGLGQRELEVASYLLGLDQRELEVARR